VDDVNLKGLLGFLEELTTAGIEIKKLHNLGDQYFKNSIKNPYLDHFIKNLEDRFDDKSLMAAFNIYKPAKLPPLSDNPSIEDLDIFPEYGNDHVQNLAHQFQCVVADSQECVEEWSSFKQFMRDNCSRLQQSWQ